MTTRTTDGVRIGSAAFRIFAGASLLAALCVPVAQYGLAGYPSPSTAAEAVALYTHPVFRAQAWVVFAQVFLMFLALWGVTLKTYRASPALILTGFVVFVLWQVLELVPRSIGLFLLSYDWAPAFVASADAAERAGLITAFERTGAMLGALGGGRRMLWALGHLLFGLAFWRRTGLARVMGGLFLFNAARLAVRMIGEATGWEWLSALSGGLTGFILSIVPLFGLIGWWLWRNADAATDRESVSVPA